MDRFGLLAIAVLGVPAALVAYITLAETALRALPRRGRAAVRPWVWIAPAIVLLTVFLVYPTVRTLVLSFMDARSETWVGFQNYIRILTDQALQTALRNNVLWVVFFTGLVLVFGLLIAVLADRVRYEGAVKTLVFLPMAISFVASSVIWKFMYDYRPPGIEQTGTLNAIVTTLGADPVAWLITEPYNNLALIVVGIWAWTGFAMVVLSAALKGIPVELLEAARVDGAGEPLIFRRVILPLLAPTIAVITTTLVIFALKAFDVVYVMTNGNFGTEVIANRMYKELFNVRDFGRASATATLLLAAIIPILVMNIRRFRFQEAIR